MNVKRIISIILTAAIVLGLVATGVTVAFAATLIEEVDLGTVTLTPGEALPDTVTIGEYGRVASLTWEKWDYTAHDWVAVTGNVEDGNVYRLNANLESTEGYTFNRYCHYYVNGQRYSYAYVREGYLNVLHPIPVGVELVEEVTFATLPTIEPGMIAEDVLDQLTVPEDAPYVIANVEWWYSVETGTSPHSGAFVEGNTYLLRPDLAPKPGYWLADPECVYDQECHYGQNIQDGLVWVDLYYRLTTPIEKVEITLEGMEPGKAVADVKVNVPEGANYAVESVTIYDDDWSIVTDTIEKDVYQLEMDLVPAEGYHFAEDMVFTINGQPWEDFSNSYDNVWLEYNVDFREPISRVDLPAIPEIKAGEAIPAPEESTPEGANYSYAIMWLGYTADGVVDPGPTFEDGKVYMAFLTADPAKGYKFTDDTVVTVNGKAPAGNCDVYKDGLTIVQLVALGDAKLVSNIKLSGPAPTAGNEPGEITGAGTGYALKDVFWGVSETGKVGTVKDHTGVFQVGQYVYLGLELEMKDGYVIDPFGTVTFNGKTYDMEYYYTYSSDGIFQTAICLGQLKEASNADTGDKTPVAALVLVTVASILGMGLVISRRKAF